MVGDGFDIESNWRNLRKKLEEKLAGANLEESVIENEREIQSDKLKEFLSSVEIKKSSMVFEKIRQVNENFNNSFDVGLNNNSPKQPNIDSNVPYFPNQKVSQNPFFQSIEPPVLRPRDMLPEEEIINKQILDSTSSVSGIRNVNVEPEKLQPKRKGRDFFNPTA